MANKELSVYGVMTKLLRGKDSSRRKITDSASAVARLASYAMGEIETLPQAEVDKWKKLGVMTPEGAVQLHDPEDALEWIVLQGV